MGPDREQPMSKKEPPEPRQVTAARLSIAWADLLVGIARSLPRWMRWYRVRMVKRSWDHRERGFQILADWEQERIEREMEQFREKSD